MTVDSAPALSEFENLVRAFKRLETSKTGRSRSTLQEILLRQKAGGYTGLAGVLAAFGAVHAQAAVREAGASELPVASSLEDLLALAELCDPAGFDPVAAEALYDHEHADVRADQSDDHDRHVAADRGGHAHHGEYVSPLASRIFKDHHDHDDHERHVGHDRAHDGHVAYADHGGHAAHAALSGHAGHESLGGSHRHGAHAGHDGMTCAADDDSYGHRGRHIAHDHGAAPHDGASHNAHAAHAGHGGHAGHVGHGHAAHSAHTGHAAHVGGEGGATPEETVSGEHVHGQTAPEESLPAHAARAHHHTHADDVAGALSLVLTEMGPVEDLSVMTAPVI